MKTCDPMLFTPYGEGQNHSGSLRVAVGHASEAANGLDNEDFFGSVAPQNENLVRKGILLAIADGLSGGVGRAAAESIVYSVLTDYYATPQSASPSAALNKVIGAINRWLFAQNRRAGERNGMLSTLSVLVLRDRGYTVAHVGDTRIYRRRGGRLELLTADHVWHGSGMQHILRRAVGLDEQVMIDFSQGELQAGDVFVMISDGVWDVLKDDELLAALSPLASPQKSAEAIVEKSILLQSQYGGVNDATAAVIRVEAC